jgi:hypothetical protein
MHRSSSVTARIAGECASPLDSLRALDGGQRKGPVSMLESPVAR